MLKNFKQDMLELIKQKNWEKLKKQIPSLPIPDITDILNNIDNAEKIIILGLLRTDIQADVFSEFDIETQKQIITSLTENQIKKIVSELAPDDRTELFETLSPKLTQHILNILDADERKKVLEFLGYPDNSVGRLMTTEYVALKIDWTIKQAIQHIKEWGKDAETIDMVYVVDNSWKLLDDIPIRRILLANEDQTVKDIMDHHFISINVNADQEDAIKLFRKYNLVALPVTDSNNNFLGIITVDDILDVLQEENTEDIAKMSAVDIETKDLGFITDLKKVPVKTIFKSRIVWLFALLLMDLITGGIIQGFETTIAKYVVLVTFLPVLVDTAGNAGSQSATLVIRALALGTVQKKDWLYLLGKELTVSSLLGIVMGVGISIMGFVRGKSFLIAEVVVVSMIVNVIIGSLIGILLPFIFAKFKKDPATASTPLITTLADIIGTGIFLSIAFLILG
ncbi:MAG: magnesium transporter [Acidobacteria bacterium]|nr:MAG: magnesium transporter [Acidobacteriota bacterium]RLE24698.1 MAG: magnesium transporter [Acidobacteriota bacterium]